MIAPQKVFLNLESYGELFAEALLLHACKVLWIGYMRESCSYIIEL